MSGGADGIDGGGDVAVERLGDVVCAFGPAVAVEQPVVHANPRKDCTVHISGRCGQAEEASFQKFFSSFEGS